jgi:deoxycytidylate deaminase
MTARESIVNQPSEAASRETIESSLEKPVELVFGLVGPTGVDLSKVCEALAAQLQAFNYETRTVTLSDLILPFIGKQRSFANEYDRINTLMSEGTDLRRETEQGDIIGRLGLAKIRAFRKSITGDSSKLPEKGVAYIVRSFKRPEEVQLYRDVYGKGFTLISVYAPREVRKKNLCGRLQGIKIDDAGPEELAVRLIARDYTEDGRLGQQVSGAFPLADFFVTSGSRAQLDANFARLIRLTFGDPFISPTRDEQAMFFAQAASVRSLDLSRQVGAAITTEEGDVVATGCNEVPKFGGGLYWEGDEGISRDVELGYDSNALVKGELVKDALQRMQRRGWLNPNLSGKPIDHLASEALEGDFAFFRDSKVFDVIEFGRAVHAEMAAITQAAMHGVSLKGKKLYCTTFPCHICARHIVASGITDVFFIEPYEKSRTDQLYGDSISVEPHEPSPKRSNFRSFVGVAPRRYLEYFSMATARKRRDGRATNPRAIGRPVRIKRFIPTYLLVEERMIEITARPPVQQQIQGERDDGTSGGVIS